MMVDPTPDNARKRRMTKSWATPLLGQLIGISLVAAGALGTAMAGAAEPPSQTGPASQIDDSLPGIGPVGPWRKFEGQYGLSEGPAPTADGGSFFTDRIGGGIYFIEPSGVVSKWFDDVHSAGLVIDHHGDLIVAEGGRGEIWKIDRETKAVQVLARGYRGIRFNSPNDLVLDAAGGVYFTDPANGARLPLPQGQQSVYYLAPTGRVTRVVDYLPRPNGLVMSADGRSLYIGLTAESEILGYHILAPGRLDPASFIFARVAFNAPTKRGESALTGVDGMTIDAGGHIYAASKFGIQIFDARGRSLGTISTPERPSNLKFGGTDRKMLFVTTYDSIFSVEMSIPGKAAR